MKYFESFITFLLPALALLIIRAHGAPIAFQLVKNQIQFGAWSLSSSNSTHGQAFVFLCRSISIYQQEQKGNDDFNFVFQVSRECNDDEWEQAFAKYQKKSIKPETVNSNETVPIQLETYHKSQRKFSYASSENFTTWIGLCIIIIMTCLIIVCTIYLLIKRKNLTAQTNMMRIFQNPIVRKSKGNDYI